MCGRFQFTADDPDERIAAILDILERTSPGKYTLGEIGPGLAAPAVIARGEKLSPVPAVFGFTGREGGNLLINARSETAGEKPTFADCLRSRRIVLPASAFFEWSRETREKYRFTVPGLPFFYLGGLYRREGEEIRFVILTRAANRGGSPAGGGAGILENTRRGLRFPFLHSKIYTGLVSTVPWRTKHWNTKTRPDGFTIFRATRCMTGRASGPRCSPRAAP